MKTFIENVNIFQAGKVFKGTIVLEGGVISEIIPFSDDVQAPVSHRYLFPGFADVHVHLREPGFSYKEDVGSGTAAAARGGFTKVCSMPNLNPVPDCAENLAAQLDAIEKGAKVKVYPYGAITVGQKGQQLASFEEMAEKVVAFSDDGKGVQSDEMMEQAMLKAKALGKIIVAHCEDESLLNGGCIHQGEYVKLHGLPGICSESEWKQVERDLKLVEKTGCAYHVCHISTAETVELIRAAKAKGLDVTCETAPHYLVFDDMMLKDEGRFRMNPPIRSARDRAALTEGIKDGTIDMIATDHAPHSAEEKSGGLKNSLNGVVGLETAFPALYTALVKTGVITLEKLIEIMHTNPCRRFGLGGGIRVGEKADFTVFDLAEKYVVDTSKFLSRGKSTPFEGMEVYGKCHLTYADGEKAWEEE
ncbi:MAG: dihydroorotase [Oscillospiraceae bacterium]|nr:dihydroorotase [Oscillospiraceae bacterium]